MGPLPDRVQKLGGLSMVTLVYLGIAAGVLGLTVWNLFTERDWRKQVSAVMVAVPLLLRILLIK